MGEKAEFFKGEKFQAVVVEIFAAVCNEEKNEGRGRNIDNSYHLTAHAAKVATSGIDVMGSDGKVHVRLAIRLADGRYALLPKLIQISENSEQEAELRKRAMEKLSPAELAALLGSKQ